MKGFYKNEGRRLSNIENVEVAMGPWSSLTYEVLPVTEQAPMCPMNTFVCNLQVHFDALSQDQIGVGDNHAVGLYQQMQCCHAINGQT